MVYPMPVFILAAYDECGKPNAMNAAWGGISDENEVMVCISAGHKTTENILNKKEFTISMATAKYTAACDFVGVVSGNDVPDKFEKAGFTAAKAEFTDAPIINELPMAIECRLKSYDPSTGHLLGEIVNVSVDESVLNEKGKIDVAKLEPITFDPSNNTYIKLGEVAGKAFCDGLSLK